MPYDIFISYCRNDNSFGRITDLVEKINSGFKLYTGRHLHCFFDQSEIKCMDDWRHKILLGLRESKLMLACLSPDYIRSEYCKWEYEEYIKHEIGKSCLGEGIAPVYFVEIPGWNELGYDQQCDHWISELRHRHYLDFRPWFHEGEKALHNTYIRERFEELNLQIRDRIERELKLSNIPGNIIAHNKQFVGRQNELDRLRQKVLATSPGTVTLVHGLGGIGKTALATEYAYVFALNYAGGRWQVRCEGKKSIPDALVELSPSLRITFNEREKSDTILQLQRVLAELKFLAFGQNPKQCLLLLDNIDNPELLSPCQLQYLPSEEWLQVIATTRLGENEFGRGERRNEDIAFFPVNEMSVEDALLMIESFQPGGRFQSDNDREAAREIAICLGGYTLAVEAVAVLLGYFSNEISFKRFLNNLKEDRIQTLDSFSEILKVPIRHGEVSLKKTLGSTFEQLTDYEKDLLSYAAFLPPEYIPLNWLRVILASKNESFLKEAESGLPDKWLMMVRRLISFRLIEISQKESIKSDILIAKMHRLVAPIVISLLVETAYLRVIKLTELSTMLLETAACFEAEIGTSISISELNSLYEISKLWLNMNRVSAANIALKCSTVLISKGYYLKSLELSEMILHSIKKSDPYNQTMLLIALNQAGVSSLYLRMNLKAQDFLLEAVALCHSETMNLRRKDKLETFTNLGAFYRENYQPDRALPICKDALAIAMEEFGENSPEVALRNTNLGLVYMGLAKMEEAVYYLSEAVRIDRLHPDLPFALCQDLSSLAEALRSKHLDKESYMRSLEALEIAKEKGVTNHPLFPFILINHARLLEDRRCLTESKELLMKSHDIIIAKYGKSSLQESHCLNNLAVNAMESGAIDSAIQSLKAAIQIEQSHGQTNSINLSHRNLNLGIAFLLNHEYDAADKVISTAFDDLESSDRNHFLYGRILLVKIIVLRIVKKNTEDLENMLVSLISSVDIVSVGVDYRWSMEYILKDFVKSNLPDWYLQFEDVYNKIANHFP